MTVACNFVFAAQRIVHSHSTALSQVGIEFAFFATGRLFLTSLEKGSLGWPSENTMYRSILVPLDGSSFGEQALPLALSIARRAGASIEVAHVHETLAPIFSRPLPGLEGAWDNEIRANRSAYLGGVVKRLMSQPKVRIVPAFLEGAVVDAILARVASQKIDLIVMTTHGHGAVARFWLGSVADELVRHSPVPILLVRPQEAKAASAVQKEPILRKFLISLDGSPLSESILEKAVPLARFMEAELFLIRVIQPIVIGNIGIPEPTSVAMAPSVMEKLETWHQERQQEATVYLEKVAATLRSSSLTVRTKVVSHEQPAMAILDEARTQGADLIAIETHGRSGLSRFFLGSIADKVIRGSSIPVLIHRATDEPTHAAKPQ
jgi:nucleotide-binding universal stress UspA family protein